MPSDKESSLMGSPKPVGTEESTQTKESETRIPRTLPALTREGLMEARVRRLYWNLDSD